MTSDPTAGAASTGTVRVERDAVPWRDRARKYKVLVDGQEVGTVGNGETHEFALAPGEHSLRLKIDWAGSPTTSFAVAPGETIAYRCRPSGKSWSALWQSIFARNRYIVLEEVPRG